MKLYAAVPIVMVMLRVSQWVSLLGVMLFCCEQIVLREN